jgi:Protein of unknown function (DUF3754)
MAIAEALKAGERVAPPPVISRTVPEPKVVTVDAEAEAPEVREKFLPITRDALLDRLTQPSVWEPGEAVKARRLFRYLDFWRRQSYAAKLLELEQAYEPFSPDSDLLVTRKYEPDESYKLQKRVVAMTAELLERANYTRVATSDFQVLLNSKDNHYGLDLQVDEAAFEELLIFHRGSTTRTGTRRDRKKFFLKKQEFEIPIYQRLFLLFKLKPEETRIREVMAAQRVDRKEATKIIKKLRGMLPPEVKSDFIYMKLFKNLPRTDIEMCFPNTKIRFRMLDKLKLGATAGGGLAGAVGTAGKLLVATNPVALAGAVIGLGGIAARQVMGFINQKNRYMVTMAQNLYFHAMADNRGVMTLLADRAAEEDAKEDMLLYTVLARERVNIADLDDVDKAIEQYLQNVFDVQADFDVQDALERLVADGIVTQAANGLLNVLPPDAGAAHIDHLWDGYLDHLPDTHAEGVEFDGDEGLELKT